MMFILYSVLWAPLFGKPLANWGFERETSLGAVLASLQAPSVRAASAAAAIQVGRCINYLRQRALLRAQLSAGGRGACANHRRCQTELRWRSGRSVAATLVSLRVERFQERAISDGVCSVVN